MKNINSKPIFNSRKCLVTNKSFAKSDLVRIVKLKNGEILVDSNAKGRGAYITKNCQDFAFIKNKRLLNRVFRTNVSEKVYDDLIKKLKGGISD